MGLSSQYKKIYIRSCVYILYCTKICKPLIFESQYKCVYICLFFPLTSLMMIIFGRNMQLICEIIYCSVLTGFFSVSLTRFCCIVFCEDGVLQFWASKICVSYCSTCSAFPRLREVRFFIFLQPGQLAAFFVAKNRVLCRFMSFYSTLCTHPAI